MMGSTGTTTGHTDPHLPEPARGSRGRDPEREARRRRLGGHLAPRALVAMALLGALGVEAACTSMVLVRRVELTEPPKPAKGKALVMVFRQRSYLGSAATFEVYRGPEMIGLVGNGTWFYAQVPRGEHIFMADFGLEKDSVSLQTKPGKTYYLEVGLNRITLVDPELAKPIIDDLAYAIPEPGA